MIVGANIFVVLLAEAKFKTFAPKASCDVTKNTEVLNCLSCDSREAVDNFPDDIKEAAKDVGEQ
jgi:predicted lactoylglutathione lyase